jgi:hypothetical protein
MLVLEFLLRQNLDELGMLFTPEPSELVTSRCPSVRRRRSWRHLPHTRAR